MNIFTKWRMGVNGWFRTRTANKIIARSTGRTDVETHLLRQAINHTRKSNPGARWSSVDDFLVNLNNRVINGLQTIPLIAGVQPLQAPTGMVFRARAVGDLFDMDHVVVQSTVRPVTGAIAARYAVERGGILEKHEISNTIIKSISARIINEMFYNAMTTSVPAATEQGSTTKTIAQTIRLIETESCPVTAIVVTSERALAAVIEAAGDTFHPMPILLLPIRQVGTGFGGIAIIQVDGCGSPDTDGLALLTCVSGSTQAAVIYSPYAPVVLLPTTGDQLQFGTMDAIQTDETVSRTILRTVQVA